MKGFKFQRMRAVARKEFIHLIRDWRSLALAIAIPVFLIAIFGWALTMDLSDVPTVVWDQSSTPQSRDYLSHFQGSPYFSVKYGVDNYRDIQKYLDTGQVIVALVIPWDFGDRILAGKTADVQVIVDGANTNNASLALGYVTNLSLIYNSNIRTKRMAGKRLGATPGQAVIEPRAWYNADLRSRNVIIPGIIALVMVVIAAMLTSVTVAREWETGTMEQLISTPLRVPELILGKIMPYFVVGLTDVAIAVAMGRWIFHVPMRGNPGLLVLASSIFLLGALFFGLLLSIALKSQVLANQIAILSGYMPTLLLSGFVFGIHNMPLPIQGITYIVPARYFIAMLRGIYLKGVGLEILWLNGLLLTIYAAAMMILAHKKLRLMLD
ncbi:ABC transporter permease [Desulfatibacillum aliphaticivorans]|uniref:ABC transporter permease n=1 Tax=Desulfatibacillum aliphaticivorans TaxID=218208 RepID=UPI00041542B3|nr:ABC transporter permease [Desulfatibacillum aliphaticivorans]